MLVKGCETMKHRMHVCYLIINYLALIFLTMGCESLQPSSQDPLVLEPQYTEPAKVSSFGELPSTVGDSDVDIPFLGDFPFQINEHMDQLTYEEPTGKWFMANGEGGFGYTIPHGSMEAGDPFEVGLIHATESSNVMERNVRVQLTPCTEDFSCSEPIIDDEVFVDVVDQEFSIYTGTIPEKGNERYIVSMEVMHEDKIEDTLVSFIYVPEKSIRATLEKDEPTEENMQTFTLTNNGPTFLSIGEDYSIEQLIDDSWMIVPYQTIVQDIGIFVKPNKAYTHTIDLSTFPSGQYRFIKTIRADIYDLEETLAISFDVD